MAEIYRRGHGTIITDVPLYRLWDNWDNHDGNGPVIRPFGTYMDRASAEREAKVLMTRWSKHVTWTKIETAT